MVQDFSSTIEGLVTGTAGGAAAGSAVPGIGTLIGGGLGLLSSLGGALGGLGGDKVGAGKGKFAGAHSAKYEPLDDARFTNEDADKYLSIAARPGISVEEAAIMMAREVSRTGQPAQTIWDGFSAGSSYIGMSASEVATTIAKQYDYWGEYPALVMYDRKPQVITLKAAAAVASPIQTMAKAPSPTASAALGQFDQLPYQNAANVAAQGLTGIPPLATTPFVLNAPPASTGANTPAATPTDNTNTYLAIGGGAALLLLLLALLLKKH